MDGWDDGPGEGTATLGQRTCPLCAAERTLTFYVAPTGERELITSPKAAAQVVAADLAHSDRERCIALLLDTKHRLLEAHTVSIGAVDHTFMSARDVYRAALMANAAAVVVAHNHPSGDPEPSREDEAITRNLVRAGEMIGVELLDHLIFGGERWISLAGRGLV